MASRALREWRTTQRAELDRLDAAVRASADRALRQQLVDAYLLALAGHFQLFCRELHDQAVTYAAANVSPTGAGPILQVLLRDRRQLDRGNARSAALAADFGMIGLDLWRKLALRDHRNHLRQRRLDQLNVWRNAIAHQALSLTHGNAAVAGTARTLPWVRLWRSNCSALAHQLDSEVAGHLANLFGRRPW